jgi:predicted nucleic acid-binding protein
VQALIEFVNVIRRKLQRQWRRIEGALAVIGELLGPARPLTAAIHTRAVTLVRDHDLSIYDALIIAAALEASCTELCSEDLQHSQKIGSLRVHNPFR